MQRIHYFHLFFTFTGILAISIWFGYSNYIKGQGTIHIALAAPLTGNNASSNGNSYKKAIHLYLDNINEQGGLKGKQLVLDEYDDQNECNQLAVQQAHKIVEDNRALAVIGHNYSECSINAGKIYQQHQIPAISPSSTGADVTADNPWYFRIIFSNKIQGRFLAHYVSKVLKQKTVSIIYKDDVYGGYLTEVFEQAAKELKIKIKHKWAFEPNEATLETRLTEIVSELATKSDAGLLFLAVHAPEGARLVQLIKDNKIGNKLIGPNSLGNNSFQEPFKKLPKEKIMPGFYTDGIYATVPLIFDSANEAAQIFRNTYRTKYEEEPDWHAAFAYDTVMVLVEAIKNSLVIGELSTLEADRRKLKEYLAQEMTLSEHAVKGITGINYFDQVGDPAFKTISVGIFKGGKIISAPTQLQNIEQLAATTDVEMAVKEGKIIMLDGALMNKVNVVYTGIDVKEISEIDIKTSTYKLDFLLWFRYSGDFSPQNIEFANAAETITLGEPIDTSADDDGMYQLFRVKGLFKMEVTSDYYLFGQSTLSIKLRHKEFTRAQLIYVADVLGMQNEEVTAKKLQRAQVLSTSSGWMLKNIRFSQNAVLEGSLGRPHYLNTEDRNIEYSSFSMNIVIQVNEFSLRTLFNKDTANGVLVASVIGLLLLNLINHLTHFLFTKIILLLQTIAAFTLLLSGEIVSTSHITNDTNIYTSQIISVIFNILWWLVSAILFHLAVEHFVWRSLERSTERKIPNIVRGFIAFLIYILSFFGIIAFVFNQPLTSLLATSGVVAMIIGLAVQINISNIFSGIALNIERPFRVGDWVKIGDNEDAKVINITWRTTRVQLRNNCVLSIPNSIAAESKIVNYSYPEEQYSITTQVNVDPKQTPALVEKILIDAALSCKLILKTSAPLVLFGGVNEWAANYKLITYSNDYAKFARISKEIWNRVWIHLNRAGIDFAINQQKIHLFQGIIERGAEATKPITLLHEIEIFQPFSEEDKQQLCQQMELQQFTVNSIIVKQGQRGDSLFIVVEGVVSVQIKTNEQANAVEVARLGAGSIFGEMALLTGEETTATIVALTDTQLYEVTKANLVPLLQKEPQASHLISKILANRQLMTQSELNNKHSSCMDKQSTYEQVLNRIENFFGLRSGKRTVES